MADYDFLIVGAGAGGSAVARTLAQSCKQSGKRVLVLERGGRLPVEDENWSADAVVAEGRYRADERWLDGDDRELRPHLYYRVGGNTKVYGAVLQRMRERDFEPLEHKEGVSPGWPVSYDQMEPWYTLAERMYMIHAAEGEDPTEPRRSEPYPFPPFEHEPYIQARADELERLGLHPIHNPLCLNRDESDPEARPCIRCRTCDPFPCKLHAKCDAETVGINPALVEGGGQVELWEHARVLRLLPEAGGKRVRGVRVERGGGELEVTADQVILSCGAINSAGLLLASRCDAWPDGCGNGNGLVGRGLMKHNHSALLAIGYTPNETVFQKTLAFHDYYFGSPEHDFPLGTVQLTGKAPWQRLKLFSDGPVPDEVLKHQARHCINWWMTSEDLPVPENRVTVTGEGRLKVDFRSTNLGAHHDLLAIWQKRLRECGYDRFWIKTMGLDVVWHQAGTCVMGGDPAASVLDPGCRSHEVENLRVVDSSFMPSMGATNLTLTIIANALRVGAELAGRPLELPRRQPADATLALMELSVGRGAGGGGVAGATPQAPQPSTHLQLVRAALRLNAEAAEGRRHGERHGGGRTAEAAAL